MQFHFSDFFKTYSKYDAAECSSIVEFRNALLNSLNSRFAGLISNVETWGNLFDNNTNEKYSDSIYILASWLSPFSYRRMKIPSKTYEKQMKELLKIEIESILDKEKLPETNFINEENDSSEQPQQVVQSTRKRGDYQAFLERQLQRQLQPIVQPKKSKSSCDSSVMEEITLYLDAAKCSNESLLTFWRANVHRFPKVAKLARRVASVSVASSNQERIFSISGFIFGPRRTRMKPKTLSKAVMLKINQKT